MKNIASPGFEPAPVQLEPSARTTAVMTTSDIYVLKGHIQTEGLIFFSKIERHFARHMLAWGFGDFKGGEIITGRKSPPPPVLPRGNGDNGGAWKWSVFLELIIVTYLTPPSTRWFHKSHFHFVADLCVWVTSEAWGSVSVGVFGGPSLESFGGGGSQWTVSTPPPSHRS